MVSRSQVLQELNEQLRRIERNRVAGAEATRPCPEGKVIATGIEPLDGLLPAGGWERGTLIEWLADNEGCGAGTLAVISLRPLLSDGGTLVVIDVERDFYPPAAARLGIDLERMIVVRPETSKEALWAAEQSLSCRGVTALLCWFDALDDRAFRRLQLAAERGGGVGMLIRPATVRSQPTWADVRLLVRPWSVGAKVEGRKLKVESQSDHSLQLSTLNSQLSTSVIAEWRFHLELLRCRKGTSGGAVNVELHHETGLVHLVSELADSADRRRASGA